MDYETRTQKRVDEAKLELAENFVNSMKNENPAADYTEIIKEAASMLGLEDKIISNLNEIYLK